MIEARVCGIPCLIDVTHFFRQAPLGPSADSDWDCYGYTEIEFEVCDRRGRRAPWLERKMTKADREEVKNLVQRKRAANAHGD